MLCVGLNAHLYALSASYRGAGVSRYIERLLTYLPTADPELRLVAFTGDERVQPAGWETHTTRVRAASPLLRILWEQTAQPWQAQRFKLDLLHAPVNVGPLWAPCPQVVTLHDLSFHLYPELFRPFNRVYQQQFSRLTAARAAGVIAVSECTRRDAIQLLGIAPERVAVVPNGVGQEMRPLQAPAELAALRQRHQLEGPVLLFVGTLEPRKNLATLLEAMSLLRQRHHLPHQLVIGGGKGWYYDAIFRRAEQLGLGDAVRFVGYVPQAELPLWYNLAEVFVYPSLYEGFGLPALEAMACGTPVVVSNSSALPEVVGEAGLTVEPRDADALAQAIYSLVTDADQRQRLRAAGLVQARPFTWQRTAQLTARAYRRILGEDHVQAR
jgi:glycosyltransferase involved in cell wall biosynthesis